MEQTFRKLDGLESLIQAGEWGVGSSQRYADVALVMRRPPNRADSFDPEDRYVVTRYVAEIGWCFDQIREIFSELEGYGNWKEELFGRLGNMVNWILTRKPEAGLVEVLNGLMHEAFAISEEIEEDGGLKTLMISTKNLILNDFADQLVDGRVLSEDESLKMLEKLGMALEQDDAIGIAADVWPDAADVDFDTDPIA